MDGPSGVMGLVAAQAARCATRPAIRADGVPDLDYATLLGQVDGIVTALRRAGVGPAHVVATAVSPAPTTAVLSLGLLAGACAAPLNPALPEPALTDALARLAPRLLVVSPTTPAWVRDVAVRARVAVAEVEPVDGGPAGALVLEAASGPGGAAGGPQGPDGLALLLPTSGTTSASKLVPLTHANVAAGTRAVIGSLDLGPSDSVLHVLPMHHIGGYVDVLLAPLASGGSLIAAAPFSVPDAARLLSRMGPTWLQLAPAMLAELLREEARVPGSLDGHRLRLVRSVSAALPEALLLEAERVMGVPVVEIYGMTEAAGVIASNPIRDRRPGTVGVPVDVEVRIVGSDGAPVPPGAQGEISVRGESVMTGYAAAPSAGPGGVVDGWLRTGDLGATDDGYLRITGRVKDVINRGGEMISPADIDRALLAHPDIADAAAFGVPHATLGESVAAVVAPRPGRAVDPGGLQAWLAERLPVTMVPRVFVVRDEVPRVNGKVRRAELATLLPHPDGAPAMHGDPVGTPIEAELTALWCEVLGVESVGRDDDFFALGGDSLRAASLVSLLGSRTDDIVYVSSVFEAPTVARFEEHLRRHYPRSAAVLEGSAPERAASARVSEPMFAEFRRLVADPWAGAGDPGRDRIGRAALILSAPRSGSTLLRSMLAGHPDLFAPPELYLLAYPTLAERRRAFPAAQSSQLEGVERALMQALAIDAESACADIAAMERAGATTDDVLRRLRDAVAPRLLVDKTPANALAVSTLTRAERLFDEPVYIHLVRHPSAMIASFDEANLAQLWWPRIVGPGGPTESLARYSPRQLAELLWVLLHENIATFLAVVPAERVVRLRFEDLLTDPRAALEPVCAALDVEFSPRLLDPYDDASHRMTDGLHGSSRMIGDPKFHRHRAIDPAATDRWRGVDGLAPLSARASGMAAGFGYADVAERPVTSGQARIWSLDRLDPSSTSHTVPMAFRLTGPLNLGALDRALSSVQARHEVLRTVFPAAADGSPRSVVGVPGPVVAPVLDLRWVREENDDATADAEILRAVEREARAPFDLAVGPLWRARVLRVADDDAVLLLVLHHLVFDGLSRPILLRELSAAYGEALAEQHSPVDTDAHQFAYVAAALAEAESAVAEADRAYWRSALEPRVAPLAVPADHAPPVGPRRLATTTRPVPAATAAGIRAIGRDRHTTAPAVWLAGTALLLHRWTGQRDLLVCMATSGRRSEEAQSLIGYFNRIVPVRLDVTGDERCADLLDQAGRRMLHAVDHDAVPLQELAALPGMAGVTFSRLLFEYQESADATLELSGLRVEAVPVRKGTPDFDLAVHVEGRASGMTLVVDADGSVFAPATLDEFADGLLSSVEWLLAHPDAPLASAPSHAPSRTEVERVMTSHPKVTDCVAVVRAETGTLDAYLMLDEFNVPTLPEIAAHARACLPAHLVPAHMVSVDHYPRRPDGSIDEKALPRQHLSPIRPGSPPPRDELEQLVADAWREVLWVDHEIGVHDSFRERGGHSLLSVQLVTLLEERLGRRVPARAITRMDTIAGLAEALRDVDAPSSDPSGGAGPDLPDDILRGLLSHTATWTGARHREGAVIVGLNTAGTRVPLFWCLQNHQEHQGLAEWLGPEQPVYGMRSGNRVMVKSDENIDLLAEFYVAEILEIRPNGPFLIGGNCQAARIAVRVATRLRARGHDVPMLVQMEKFDPYPYDGPTAFLFGEASDRDPYLLYSEPQIGYAKYVTGPMWLRSIPGAHGEFFGEPNIEVLARVLDEQLRWAVDGTPVEGAVAVAHCEPLADGAYRAAVEVIESSAGPLRPGEPVRIAVSVTNLSGEDWPGSGGGLGVACRWRDGDGAPGRVAATVLFDAPVPSGSSMSAHLVVPTPDRSGVVELEVDVVEQGITWFHERGSAPVRLAFGVGRGVPPWRQRVSRAGRLVSRVRGAW